VFRCTPLFSNRATALNSRDCRPATQEPLPYLLMALIARILCVDVTRLCPECHELMSSLGCTETQQNKPPGASFIKQSGPIASLSTIRRVCAILAVNAVLNRMRQNRETRKKIDSDFAESDLGHRQLQIGRDLRISTECEDIIDHRQGLQLDSALAPSKPDGPHCMPTRMRQPAGAK